MVYSPVFQENKPPFYDVLDNTFINSQDQYPGFCVYNPGAASN
jgi:hypothetical protein